MNPKKEMERVLEILKVEPIRFIDGRYKDGFVDQSALLYLLHKKKAKICFLGDIAFVKLSEEDK